MTDWQIIKSYSLSLKEKSKDEILIEKSCMQSSTFKNTHVKARN